MSTVGRWAGDVARALMGKGLSDADTQRLMNAGFRSMLGGLLTTGPERTVQMWLDTFGKSPWLHSCVNRIAEDMAALRWRLYRYDGTEPGADGEIPKRLIGQHELLKLWKNPNPMMIGWVFRYLLVSFLDLAGEGPVLIDRPPGSLKPKGLWPIPPHWVTDIPRVEHPYFKVWLAGKEWDVPPGEIIWLYRPNPLNPYARGLGLARAIDDEVSGYEAMAKYNGAFFKNGAQPAGVLMVPGMSPDDAEDMRVKWNQQHQGFMNAFKMAFFGYEPTVGKTEFHDLTKSHRDLEFNEGRGAYRDVIIQGGFGMSPEKLGILDNSNRSTIEAAELQHSTNILLPRAEFLEESFDVYLVPLFGDPMLCFKPDNPVKESARWLREHAVTLYGKGIATKNEARAANGLPHDPEGDVYAEPLNTAIVVAGDPRTTLDPRRDDGSKSAVTLDLVEVVDRRRNGNGRHH